MQDIIDLKTKWSRVGYSQIYRMWATAFFFIGSMFIIVLLIATSFINMAVADIKAKDAITQIRYENTRHFKN